MSNIDIQVYGMHERDSMIADTVKKLGLSYDNVHYEDRPNGGPCIYTAKKAWLAPISDGITHRVALADDVHVCTGFKEICEQIADAHPDAIISFFPYQFENKMKKIEGFSTPYCLSQWLYGCAVMMPVKYLEDCFTYTMDVFNDECSDEEGIKRWADTHGVQVLTTIPAIVQHIGDYSLLRKKTVVVRTEYFEENPKADWSNKNILKYTEKEWFFSNYGKRRTGCGHIQIYKDNDHNLTSTNRE